MQKKKKELEFEKLEQPKTPEIVEWWIRDLLPKNKLSLLAAMGGTGKTSLAAFLAQKLSKERLARVAIWSFEDTPQDFTNKIGYQDMVSFIRTKNDQPIDMTDEEDATRLNNYLYDNGIDILIVDPMSALLRGDTNDNQKVRALLNPFIRIADDLQLTVLGIHHFRKQSRGGGDVRSCVMGASAWVDTARHTLSLVKNEREQRFLEVAKSNMTREGICWEVFTSVNENEAFCVTDIVEAEHGAASKALEDPEVERLSPVIMNLKEKFNLGAPFNLDDVDEAGNRKSFYNWVIKNPEKIQVCAKKKDGKKAYIFI